MIAYPPGMLDVRPIVYRKGDRITTMRQLMVTTAFFVFLVGIVGAIALWGNALLMMNEPPAQRTAVEPMQPTSEGGRKNITLFFLAGDGNSFQRETREIGSGVTITEDVKGALTELMRGPEDNDLVRTIPQETRLLNLFIDSSGTAYVDFDRHLQDDLPGGAQDEVSAVYSIVNTLAFNFSRITRVQILVEGVEVPTLAGHVDTRMSLPPQYAF